MRTVNFCILRAFYRQEKDLDISRGMIEDSLERESEHRWEEWPFQIIRKVSIIEHRISAPVPTQRNNSIVTLPASIVPANSRAKSSWENGLKHVSAWEGWHHCRISALSWPTMNTSTDYTMLGS